MKKTYSAEPSIKKILAHYATASTAYQIVNPDMSHWTYSETFIGFKKALGWTIVAGEPVGPMAAQSEAIAAFEAAHPRVAYFAAEAPFYDRHRGTHPHRVYLGSQPVWTPEDWAKAMRHASLRYQCHRTKNKGMRVSEVSATEAGLQPDFDRLRKAWLGTRGLPSLHFLGESDIFSAPGARRFFCARFEERLVGLLVLAPIPQRHGYLVELSLRHPEAPNGTIESLLDAVFRGISDRQMVTLGLTPLRPSLWQKKNPFWVRGLFAMMRRLGSPFYDFSGLTRFKEKCRPGGWEPLFLMSRQPVGPRTLMALATVFLK